MERERIDKGEIFQKVTDTTAILFSLGYLAESLAKEEKAADADIISTMQTLFYYLEKQLDEVKYAVMRLHTVIISKGEPFVEEGEPFDED